MPAIQFFTAHNFNAVSWPAHADGQYARSLLRALLQHGTSAFIDNVSAEVQILQSDDLILPLVLARTGVQNSYVCSPTTHYIDYAKAELEIELSQHPLLKHSLKPLIQTLGAAFQPLGFEDVVYVNNWLLSTNLYPAFDLTRLESIREALIQRFPRQAIIFRSVNLMLNRPLYTQLKALGFQPVASRQIYILDPASGQHRQKNPYKEDLRLAKKSAYHWENAEQIQWRDIPRLRWLYDDLYLRKYSRFNPQFNEQFLRSSLEQKWITYYVLKQGDRIDAMLGYVQRNGVFTAPMVGYDTRLPQKTGLYRLITLKLIQEAEKQGWILNHSSGVSRFKTLRGCVPSLEYNMVYTAHLPAHRQVPWRLLQGISQHLLEPMVQKLKL